MTNLLNDFSEVWAVPGANHIIDVIRPDGLTAVYGRTPEDVQQREPGARRMTWRAWQAAASARQQTPIRWERTTNTKYHEMLEVLPPAFWSGGAFLVGEPTDHDFATGRPRFAAYLERGGSYYVASRPLTVNELKTQLGR